MAGIDGVDPTGQSRDSWLAPGLSLRPGQLVQGVLEAVKEGLALRVGSSLLSIVGGAMVGAKAGQRAAGEVVQSDHGLQLRLLPLQTPAAGSSLTAPPPPVTQAMSPVLLGILESLGNVSAAPQAAQLLPPRLPQSETAVRLLLSLFLTRASTGEDLQVLGSLTEQAATCGALSRHNAESFARLVREWLPTGEAWLATASSSTAASNLEGAIGRLLTGGTRPSQPGSPDLKPAEAAALAGLMARFLETEPQFLQRAVIDPGTLAAAVRLFLAKHPEVPQGQAVPPAGRDADALASLIRHVVEALDSSPARVVRSAAARAGQPAEARLAAALASGRLEQVLAGLDREVRTQLGRLRQSGPFVEFLRRTGQEVAFDQAARRVLDRSSGAQLQNLRGIDAPYQFLEIPFPPHAPIRHAQVHILGEENDRRRKRDPQNAVVAIEITTTRLGDLWISLTIHQGSCRCRIRARTAEVVRAIEAHAPELAGRLNATGYQGAQVSASLWDGDRVAETAALLAHLQGINLHA